MNLIEARKFAHDGWVRSPSRTDSAWRRLQGVTWEVEGPHYSEPFKLEDLDANDWEPKPAPAKPVEADVWKHANGQIVLADPQEKDISWIRQGWRKIRVREVTE